MKRWLKDVRVSYSVLAIACLIPLVFLLVLLRHYGVLAPFWDQWELVPFIQKLREGHLTLADLWSQHNEHRILFPRIIMLTLASISKWNTIYETYVNVALASLSVGLIVKMLRQTFNSSRRSFVVIAALSAWILYSPIQWENWLWGWQIQWFLSIVGVVGTIWAIHHWPRRLPDKWRLVSAGLLALLATYSLANGIIIWPIALAIMAIRREGKRAMAWWSGAGVLSAVTYYYHYVNPGYQPSKGLFLHQPKTFAHYVLVYIGHPLAKDFRASAIMGAAICALFGLSIAYLLLVKRGNWGRCLSWLALAAYTGAGAVSTAISRLGYGVEQGYSSRYTTVSSLFLVSTVVLVAMALHDYYQGLQSSRGVKSGALWVALAPVALAQITIYIQGGKIDLALIATVIFSVLSLMVCYNFVIALLPTHFRPKALMSSSQAQLSLLLSIAALVSMNYIVGTRELKQQSNHLAKVKHCVDTATTVADPCLTLPYPNADIVWGRLDYLKSIGWGGLEKR